MNNYSIVNVVFDVNNEGNTTKENARRRQQLKKQMDTMVERLKEDAVYEMMAEKDPDLKSILEEYRKLG